MTDMRDPSLLGEALLNGLASARAAYGKTITASEAWDVHVQHFSVPDHDANPSCITKYGYAQGKKPE